MFVPYSENCDRQNIEMYLEKQLYESPVFFSNNRVMLVKKKEKYEIHMLVPTNALNNSSGFTRKWRMYFRDNEIFLRERVTPGSMFTVFSVAMTGVAAFGTLITGEYSLGVASLGLFVLFFGMFYVIHPKHVKKFLNAKMG